MNPNRTKAQKLDSAMTFVIMLVVLSTLVLGAYIMMHDVVPAFHNFLNQLQGIKTTD